jgi:hypothetical protein
LPDGVFVKDGDALRFVALAPPTDDDVLTLLARLMTRITALLDTGDDTEATDRALDDEAIATAMGDAIRPVARNLSLVPGTEKPLCAMVDGFSLHAGLDVAADDRKRLERLLRYGCRPVVANSRLSIRDDGRVVYTLRKTYYDGRTQLVMEPVAFLHRLAALIPPPWLNQVRFHGVFAPHARGRAQVVALCPKQVPQNAATKDPSKQDGDLPAALPISRRIAWSDLLRRTFGVDVLTCPHCPGKMRLLALIKDPKVARKILVHLRLPSDALPVAAARAPPQEDFDFSDFA